MFAKTSFGGLRKPDETPVATSGSAMFHLLITRRQADRIGVPIVDNARFDPGGAAGRAWGTPGGSRIRRSGPRR
jgi:hypothetical protein